jgi:hypothetical protein
LELLRFGVGIGRQRAHGFSIAQSSMARISARRLPAQTGGRSPGRINIPLQGTQIFKDSFFEDGFGEGGHIPQLVVNLKRDSRVTGIPPRRNHLYCVWLIPCDDAAQ